MPSNLYALPPTGLSYHPDVKNPHIHSTFEVGESSSHSNPDVQAFWGIAQAIEAILGITSNTPVLMYYENPVTSFPILSSLYVTNTVAQSTAYHLSRDKLNDNNYFSWSQLVKMVLKGRHKFGFLVREIPYPPPGDPQERYVRPRLINTYKRRGKKVT